MKKIVINKEEIKNNVKKAVPYVAVSAGVALAGFCCYKVYKHGVGKGYIKGLADGKDNFIRFISDPAAFHVTSYVNGINTTDKFTYISSVVCGNESELAKALSSYYGENAAPNIIDQCAEIAHTFFTNPDAIPGTILIGK